MSLSLSALKRMGGFSFRIRKQKLMPLSPNLKRYGNNADIRVFVRGDAEVNYGRMMEVMGVINSAGLGGLP